MLLFPFETLSLMKIVLFKHFRVHRRQAVCAVNDFVGKLAATKRRRARSKKTLLQTPPPFSPLCQRTHRYRHRHTDTRRCQLALVAVRQPVQLTTED